VCEGRHGNIAIEYRGRAAAVAGNSGTRRPIEIESKPSENPATQPKRPRDCSGSGCPRANHRARGSPPEESSNEARKLAAIARSRRRLALHSAQTAPPFGCAGLRSGPADDKERRKTKEKGDTSNEVTKGTFLKSFDTGTPVLLTDGQKSHTIVAENPLGECVVADGPDFVSAMLAGAR